LAVALEGLAVVGRNLAELRRLIGTSLVYPLLVLALAYQLAVFFALKLAPEFAQIDLFPAWAQNFFATIAGLKTSAHIWGPAIPLVFVVLLVIWWQAASKALIVQPRLAARLLGWLPGVRQLLDYSQAATFSEVLGLLVEQRAPLDQSLTLAASATGNQQLQTAAHRIAEQSRQGQPLAAAPANSPGMPPLLVWLLGASANQASLVASLRESARSYRQRALYQGEMLRSYLPLVLSVAIGGTATLAYTAMLFIPWAALLHQVSQP
jgi:type II secretory pathway component PulF